MVKVPKAVILGIDGGSLDLIEPLVAQGELPNLRALLAESAYGPTTTTWPAHTAPGWSTFVSGCQPGGHGVYQFFGTQEPDYRDRLTGTGDFGCSTIWEWLAAQGHSAGIINVPMSHPPRDLPGYQVTWPLERTLRFGRPDGLPGELAREGASFTPDILTMFQGDHSYVDFALDNVRARTRSITYLMRNRPVDVVMAVLTEVDRVCHHYWHFSDSCHPRHVLPDEPHWHEAIRLVYRAVDAAFGEILDLVDEDTPVLVLSDHGFGQGRLNIGINTLLAEVGLLATRPGDGGRAPWFDGEGNTVDFASTRAYMPAPGSYGVNINLHGRQEEGTVDPGEAKALTRELTDLFLQIKAPDTGVPVFSGVLPREEAYPGPMCNQAPDLVLIPADEGVLADPGLAGGVWRPSAQTGMHRYEGMWAYRSPNVARGRRSEAVALRDLAPTLLHDLGLSFPRQIQGRPLPEISATRPVEGPFLPDPAFPSSQNSQPVLRDGREDNLTAQALSAMGYL